MCPLGLAVGIFKKDPAHTRWVHGGSFAGFFLKIPTMYLVGPLRVNGWANCKSNQNGLGGSMLGVLFQNPQ